MVGKYDKLKPSNTLAREFVIEVIRAGTGHVSLDNAARGAATAAFIGSLYDELVKHFEAPEQK